MVRCWLLESGPDYIMNLLIKTYDTNENGTISVDEFLAFFNDNNNTIG